MDNIDSQGDGLKIGLELEFQVLDQEGNVSNSSSLLYSDPENEGFIVKECSQSMIEVIAPPSGDIGQLARNFTKEVLNLKRIADKHGLRLLPSGTIGKDAAPKENVAPRYASKRAVLGDALRDLEYHICGTHVHTDRLSPERQADQYKVTTAMDPAFALMSSTPFFAGKNTLDDYRVHIYRQTVFKDFPLQGQLLPYLDHIEEIIARQMETYAQWISKVKAKGFDSEGFTILNTCWGPVKLAERTVEGRGADANTVSRVLAWAALYKGVNEFVRGQDPKIRVATEDTPVERLFRPDNSTLVIPSYGTLRAFEDTGIHPGIRDPSLHIYISNMVSLAQQELAPGHHRFLAPFIDSLDTRRTLSTDIVDYAKRNGIYSTDNLSDEAARKIRLHVADVFETDLETFRQSLDQN